jgi:putative flippase GtrA
MISLKRLLKFGLVGLVATGIHLGVLLVLIHASLLQTGVANVVAFITAFFVSNSLQQRFTFADRLDGQALKKRGVLLLFAVNSVAAYGLGTKASGSLIPLLALVPPVINYTLLHLLSGDPGWKR